MHPEYRTFLDLFLSVARFSCDQSDAILDSDETDALPGEERKSVAITPDEFFEYLYEPRDTVSQLRDHLNNSTNLICLVGPPGSGKSTIVTKLQRELRENRMTGRTNPSFMVLIDFRIETETNNF